MDFILVHDDPVLFDSVFGEATIVAPPSVKIVASGFMTLDGAKVCVEGDEGSVVVHNVPYTTAVHKTPGQGTLTIKALDSAHVASETTSAGKAVLLAAEGVRFEAQLDGVVEPTQVIGGKLEKGSLGPFEGTGQFQTRNDFLRGS